MAPQVNLPNPSSLHDHEPAGVDEQPPMSSLHPLEPLEDVDQLLLGSDGDMDAELDAALQFLDESFSSGEQHHDQVSFAAGSKSSGSVSSSNDEDNSSNSTTKQRPKRRQRVTMKQQISQLQCTVEELTTELESLHSKPQVIAETLLHDQAEARELMWQQIATRQLERRKRSEQDNVMLREMLSLQVQEAKNLKRILKRRSRIEMMEKMLGVKRLKSAETDDVENTLCVLETMLLDTDSSYVDIDQALIGLEKVPCPGKTRHTDRKTTNGVFLEIMEKQLVPFSRKATEDAVWAALGQACMEGLKCVKDFNAQVDFHAQHSQKSNDAMTISYLATTAGFPNLHSVQIRKVVRKFVETDRTVFICQLLTKPKHENGCPGITLRGTLRIVMGKAEGADEETTYIKTLHSVSRYVPLPRNSQTHEDVDMAIVAWDEMLTRISERMECFLLDDSYQ